MRGLTGKEVVAQITSSGGEARCVQGDVSQAEDFARLVDACEETFGRWDVLVNNNAAVTHTKPLTEFTEPEIDLMFAVNVKGTVRLRPRPTPPAEARNSSPGSPQCPRSAGSERSRRSPTS